MTSLEDKRKTATKSIEKKTGAKNLMVCMADDMHPYNCDGMFGGSCIHCESKVEKEHNPKTCALCNWDN